MPSPASYGEASYASPRLPPLTGSPRNVRSVGAAFDSREVQVRRLQQLNLTPRLGGAGRVGMLPGGRIGDSWTDRPVLARRNKFTQGFIKPIPPRKKTEEEMTDGELAAKARRDRVAVLVEQRREQLSIVKANAAAEEQRRSERRARRNARRGAAAMRIQACARGKRCRQAWLATRDRLMAEREDLRDKRGVLRLQAAVRGLAGRGLAADLRRHKAQGEQAVMASRIQVSFRTRAAGVMATKRSLQLQLEENERYFGLMKARPHLAPFRLTTTPPSLATASNLAAPPCRRSCTTTYVATRRPRCSVRGRRTVMASLRPSGSSSSGRSSSGRRASSSGTTVPRGAPRAGPTRRRRDAAVPRGLPHMEPRCAVVRVRRAIAPPRSSHQRLSVARPTGARAATASGARHPRPA